MTSTYTLIKYIKKCNISLAIYATLCKINDLFCDATVHLIDAMILHIYIHVPFSYPKIEHILRNERKTSFLTTEDSYEETCHLAGVVNFNSLGFL